MPDDRIAWLWSLPSQRRVLRAGEYLFHRGDAVVSLYLVRAGELRLVREQSDGSLLVLQHAGPGTVLAEASLFAPRYHCAAVAGRDSELDAVAVSTVRGRMRADAELAESWAAYLAGEVQKARFRSELLSLKTVAQRLDAWLAWEGPDLPSRGQWHLLARQLAVSPEALYREIARRRR